LNQKGRVFGPFPFQFNSLLPANQKLRLFIESKRSNQKVARVFIIL